MPMTLLDAGYVLAVCNALRGQVEKLGLSIGKEPVWGNAVFRRETDPFSKQESLVAAWQDQPRNGSVTFFPDGRVFAEYQVLQPQPGRSDSYVEAVQVWGRPDALKGEPVIRQWAN